MQVLVLDAEKRKSVPVVRALGSAGVHVVCASASRLAAGGWSRSCAQRRRCPPVATAEFVPWLLDKVESGTIDVVLGLEDDTIIRLLEHRSKLVPHTALPYPALDVFLTAAEKDRTLAAARAAGVPVPWTAVPESLDDARAALARCSYPCVVKPRRGSGGRGMALLRHPSEMGRYLDVHEHHPLPLIQEFIPHGGAYGVSLLYDEHGRARASFTHRRLREFPVSGGPSTLCESVSFPEIEEMACRLLDHLGWQGVAMVEFLIDARDGSPWLMEVNPRFWGSVSLGIAAGVDFPVLLCLLATGHDVEAPVARLGVRGRWLVPGDVMHFLQNPQRFRLEPSFFRFLDRDTHDFLLSWRDPLPMVALLAEMLFGGSKDGPASLVRRGW